jgi:hypothetical protein
MPASTAAASRFPGRPGQRSLAAGSDGGQARQTAAPHPRDSGGGALVKLSKAYAAAGAVCLVGGSLAVVVQHLVTPVDASMPMAKPVAQVATHHDAMTVR